MCSVYDSYRIVQQNKMEEGKRWVVSDYKNAVLSFQKYAWKRSICCCDKCLFYTSGGVTFKSMSVALCRLISVFQKKKKIEFVFTRLSLTGSGRWRQDGVKARGLLRWNQMTDKGSGTGGPVLSWSAGPLSYRKPQLPIHSPAKDTSD